MAAFSNLSCPTSSCEASGDEILSCVPDHDQPEAGATHHVPLVTPPGKALDPIVALATSVHASPGVYTLLLGSGISSVAGVPTGWQVVTDLVGKIAATQAPDDPEAANAAKADPEAWWSQHGYETPLGYSTLLNALAPTPAARQALLAGYFEPTDADREEGRKVPGNAHHAIAQLVARGTVRVILTTNFDRLLERALEEAGIPPQVLHRPEQLTAATPLAHARASVIKLHGDYADLDQRNTADELAQYPEALAAYLRRVLDEYGLIISGWSADWDIALARCLEEAPARRYPLFWSSYGAISENTRRLIALFGAVSLPGLTAENLFTGLQSRLEALDRLADPPFTADIAVQRLKRALPDPRRRIELFDLVDGEIQQLASRTADTTRHPLSGVSFTDQFTAYEQESVTAARLLATGVFHGGEQHAALWIRSLRRLMSARRTFAGGFNPQSEAMRHYPALLCLWVMGVSAILAEQENLLARLLLEPTWIPTTGATKPQPAVRCLNPLRIVATDETTQGGTRWLYPQSHHIRAASRNALKDVEPDDDTHKTACDRLEYLASLVAMSDPDESGRLPWAGEFILEGRYLGEDQRLGGRIESEIASKWPLLEGGAFGGDPEQAKAAQIALTAWISQHGRFFL
jgi:hypothetical protein